MHFHFPSLVLGFFLGIALIFVLFCLLVRSSIKVEMDTWRRLSQLDSISDEKNPQG